MMEYSKAIEKAQSAMASSLEEGKTAEDIWNQIEIGNIANERKQNLFSILSLSQMKEIVDTIPRFSRFEVKINDQVTFDNFVKNNINKPFVTKDSQGRSLRFEYTLNQDGENCILVQGKWVLVDSPIIEKLLKWLTLLDEKETLVIRKKLAKENLEILLLGRTQAGFPTAMTIVSKCKEE